MVGLCLLLFLKNIFGKPGHGRTIFVFVSEKYINLYHFKGRFNGQQTEDIFLIFFQKIGIYISCKLSFSPEK